MRRRCSRCRAKSASPGPSDYARDPGRDGRRDSDRDTAPVKRDGVCRWYSGRTYCETPVPGVAAERPDRPRAAHRADAAGRTRSARTGLPGPAAGCVGRGARAAPGADIRRGDDEVRAAGAGGCGTRRRGWAAAVAAARQAPERRGRGQADLPVGDVVGAAPLGDRRRGLGAPAGTAAVESAAGCARVAVDESPTSRCGAAWAAGRFPLRGRSCRTSTTMPARPVRRTVPAGPVRMSAATPRPPASRRRGDAGRARSPEPRPR